jgi:hypothetical protein
MKHLSNELREEIRRIAARHGAEDVRVFVKHDLEDLLGRRVDVVTEAAISREIREQVLKDAVPI